MSKAKSQILPPVHPGGLHGTDAAQHERDGLDLRVPVTRIAELRDERRSITPDTALRLARYFNTSPGILAESSEGLRSGNNAGQVFTRYREGSAAGFTYRCERGLIDSNFPAAGSAPAGQPRRRSLQMMT
jgi:hypothetical protein